MKSPPRRPRRRLLYTIYLVGVAQLAVAGISIFVVQRLLERAPWQFEPARSKALLESFAEFFEAPETLGRALAKLSDIDLTFYRADGQLVASTQPAIPPLAPADVERLARVPSLSIPTIGPVPITAAAVTRDGRLVGYGLVHRRPPPSSAAAKELGASPPMPRGPAVPRRPPPGPRPPPLPFQASRLPIAIACALMGAAVISFLFARSLARPLAKMAEAAQAFGAGDLQARARLDRNDELGAVAHTFDEMAERVNALLNAQREFLANVSHELRTPLARIRVALDLAAEGDLAAARESLRLIAQDWDDLDRLVEDVMTVARFDLGQDARIPAVKLKHARIEAGALAERSAAAFRSLHRHRLDVVLDDGPLELEGDAALLRRVIDNLLNNAGKYSEPNTPIRLDVHRREGAIEFAVTDQGIGIDAADLPRLFEPFFRSDRSRARKTGGVGLGLTLAKRIVEAHHGRISVHSKAGAGTTVTFTVPVGSVGDDEEPPASPV